MRTKKILLGFTAILAVGVTTAACSGDDDDDGGSYTLASGDYDLDVTDVPAATNTCFPPPDGDSLIGLLTATSLPIEIVSTNGTSFQIIMPEVAQAILPSVEGTITGNVLAADGDITGLVVATNCSMSIVAVVDAELVADNSFSIAALTVDITVPSSSAAGCSPLVGETIPGTNDLVPWPTLTAGSSGTCTLTLVGDGVISL